MFTLVVFILSLSVSAVYGQALDRVRRPLLRNQPRAPLGIVDLTDEQKEQLASLQEKHRDLQQQFMEKTLDLRTKLNELREDVSVNAKEIESIQDELFNLKIEQMKMNYSHQKEIKKVYTPDQQEKLSVWSAGVWRGRAELNRRVPQRSPSLRRFPNRGRGQMLGRRRSLQRDIIWRRR